VSTLMTDSRPSRLVLLLVAMACLLLPACTGAEPPEQSPSVPDREKIAAAIAGQAEVINDFDQVRAIVVATDARIVFEQYYETDQEAYWGVQSITKSVISTLVGIALEEGLIGSIDATLAHLLPRYANIMSPAVADTTLRQLLTMTAGFPSGDEVLAPAFTRSEDWVREILTSPEAPPGEGFLYSNGTSHLLAALLEEATGTSALDFARSRLFGPLGIDTRPTFRPTHLQEPQAKEVAAFQNADFAWPVDPQGISTGWWGIKLRPRDMVKLGQLFLGGGRWGDRQVVPAEWVEQATTQQVAVDGLGEGNGYGYQWWTGTVGGDEAFQAMGYGGQLIEVIPGRNLVVVTATEVRFDDITSYGIDVGTLLSLVENAIVSQFPAD
jgi:CubicO group peptidase (beta-lactamase class C family)